MRALFDDENLFVNIGLQKDRVFIYSVTDSTSTRAREAFLTSKKPCEPMLFIAGEQTAGRGTRGRSFESKRDTGLYFSLLFSKEKSFLSDNEITPLAAAAVFSSLSEILGRDASRGLFIKWVNDIYMNGKKICGILTERVFASDGIGYIIGIGINLYGSDFSPEIRNIAASVEELTGERINKELLLSSVIKRLISALSIPEEKERLLSEYRKNILAPKTPITVTDGLKNTKDATVIGLDENFGLIVRYGDGSVESLISGDISIKL